MSPQDATEITPQAAAPPAAGRKLGLALLVIATAQLMLARSPATPASTRPRCSPTPPTRCGRRPRSRVHAALTRALADQLTDRLAPAAT